MVLLDINLPGMNGFQALEVFRSAPGLKAVPVVAVTANAMPRDIAQFKAAGFADYLIKPLKVDLFYEVIERCLGSNDARGGARIG